MAIYKANEIKVSCCTKQADPNQTDYAIIHGKNQIQGSNDWIGRNFFQYDLSGLPGGAAIKSAKMYVHCWRWSDNTANGTTNIARVTSEWSEDTACWNNMPTWEGRYLAKDVTPPEVNTWAEWDITSLVTEWMNGVYPNYGLHVVNNNEGEYRIQWDIYNRYSVDVLGEDYGTYILVEYELFGDADTYYKAGSSIFEELAGIVRANTEITDPMYPSQILSVLENASFHYEQLTDSDLGAIYAEIYG